MQEAKAGRFIVRQTPESMVQKPDIWIGDVDVDEAGKPDLNTTTLRQKPRSDRITRHPKKGGNSTAR